MNNHQKTTMSKLQTTTLSPYYYLILHANGSLSLISHLILSKWKYFTFDNKISYIFQINKIIPKLKSCLEKHFTCEKKDKNILIPPLVL